MANYTTAADLHTDILFRCGEPTTTSSDFYNVALQYLNRAYQSICLGGTELIPTLAEEWWWLRKNPPGTLTLLPVTTTGTVSVQNNNAAITFSIAPSVSVANYFFQVDGDNGDVFRISSHTAAATAATLDSVYTGTTSGAATYKLMKLQYDLASDVLRVISPMRAYRAERNYEIVGMDALPMDREYPIAIIEAGVPSAFAHVGETTVRFNRFGGVESTELIRVEYDYLYQPGSLVVDADDVSAEAPIASLTPVLPLHWRHVLSDWATFWLMMDKNDDRADATGLAAKNGLMAMAAENRHKMGAQSGGAFGSIRPRQDDRDLIPFRTAGGLIVG